jgi:hypothetical protein
MLIFGYPLIVVTIYAAYGKFGYNRVDSYCTSVPSTSLFDPVMLSYYLPLVIIVFTSTGLVTSVIVTFAKLVHKAGRVKANPRVLPAAETVVDSHSCRAANYVHSNAAPAPAPAQAPVTGTATDTSKSSIVSEKSVKNAEITASIVAFCLSFNLIMAVMFTSKLLRVGHDSQDQASYDKWLTCVFSNFDGVDDESWIGICGKHAAPFSNPSYASFLTTIAFLIPAQSIAVSVSFFHVFWEPIGCIFCSVKVDREFARILEIRREKREKENQVQL